MLTFVGQIREYKNLPELIGLVRALQDPMVTLLIAGRTASPGLDQRLQAAAGADPRVRLDLRLIPEHEIQVFLNAADLVVLPYREILNSAAALLALSFNKPVLLPEIGALPELQERVGPAWVRLYRGALTPNILDDALAWAHSTRRPAEAPLGPYDWAEVARATIAAYHCVLAGRNPPRQQPSMALAAGKRP